MSDKNSKNSEEKIEINKHDNIKEASNKKGELPHINIRKISTLSDSIINYFLIGLCLFLNSAYNLNWFELKNHSDFLYTYFLFSAIVLYIIGLMNWYEGKELLFLFDFILSFYFFVIYFKEGHFKNKFDGFNQDIIIDMNDNDKLQGVFYIILFSLFLMIISSSFKKGIIYMINYIFLFIGFVFLFCDKFFGKKHNWIKKAHNYSFIVAGGFMWIIGVLKFINQAFLTKDNRLLGQTD